VTLIVSRALYLSPSASHPRDYGNRNRVWQTASFLKRRGFEIHFLLYPMEADWSRSIPNSADEMRKAWTSFSVIPPSKALHGKSAGRHHELDEWWDPQIGNYLTWLFARQHFDVFYVNYAFLSKAFEYAPVTTRKILDTHDLFSGRLEMLEKAGAQPEFFYTTMEEERKAFKRADVVLAIKDSEAVLMQENSPGPVIALPYFPDTAEITASTRICDKSETLRVGFIGALNTVNVLNMQRFLTAFQRFARIFTPPLIIRVAGEVCSRLFSGRGVELLGKVDNIAEYYASVDVIIAPLMFSTGLKIKIAEALSYGKPVVSVESAFDGFQATDEYHTLNSYDAVCRALVKLAFDRERLAKLSERSAIAAQIARRRREQGFRILGDTLRNSVLRILFVTDIPIWKRDTLNSSRLAQWADLCADMLPTVIIYTGDQHVSIRKPDSLKALAVVGVPMTNGAAFGGVVRDMVQGLEVKEVVLAISNSEVLAIADSFKSAFGVFTMDVFSNPEACAKIDGATGMIAADIILVEANGVEALRGISVTPLRYAPVALHGLTAIQPKSIVAALCGPTSDDIAWLEILKRRLSGVVSITIVGRCSLEDNIPESELFGHLQQHGKPTMLVAVGRDTRMASIYQALARHIGVSFERLSGVDLPRMRVTRHGRLVLCTNYDDEIRCIADNDLRNVASKKDASDGGWSTYWRIIQGRRESRAATSRN
jgi:glycosyltransferase involved in cell wall biosynthesis